MHMIRRTAAALALAGTAFLGACQDVEADEEPNIVNLQLTVGASSVLAPATGTAQSGQVVLVAGQSNAYSIRFLDATGSVDAVVAEHADDFGLTITAPAGWTVTYGARAGGVFTGTITPIGAGTQSITVALEHEGHVEVSRPLQVTVQ